MINEKGERALAYIITIDEIQPLDGYDRVEYARTNGWWCIVGKADNFKVGDKAVYFEVDSKVPSDDERFAFLSNRNYKIKTQKMCKVYSQGLIMPITTFPELEGMSVGTDVTNILKVKYVLEEDNTRKKNYTPTPKTPWQKFKKKVKTIIYKILHKQIDNDFDKSFPKFVHKTDEERVENMPFILNDNKKEWVATEKLDGTSCTYALIRDGKKFDYYVCSRNLRLEPMTESESEGNIYWNMSYKYKIKENLEKYLNDNEDMEWVCIQGEGVGSVQGNPLKLKENDLYVFNFIDSKNGRFPSHKAKELMESFGMKFVPILGIVTLPNNMEDMKVTADGKSVINPKVDREGIVYRDLNGYQSFKNVSRKYLLKKGE